MRVARILRTPRFAPLLAGQAVNAIGNWIAVIAVWGFAAYEFDAGALDLALLFVVLSVPGAFLGPLLGVPIDRLGPRRTLILANLLGFVNALALTQADSYTTVIVLAVPLGLIESLGSASLDSLPPRLVDDDDLVSANALLDGTEDVAIVVGPIIAAVVHVWWGLAGAFLADALTFLVGAVVALHLRIDHTPPESDDEPSTWRDLREGFSIVRRTDGVRWTIAVASITYLLWALFGVLEPLYVRDVLGESDTVFALLQTVWGVGLVGTGILVATLGDRIARPRYVALATIASGITAAVYLGTKSLAVAFVGVFLWGVDTAAFYAPAKTLLQRYTPASAHGRVMSINQSLSPLATILCTPVAAIAVGAIGVQMLGVVGGVLVVVAGLVALRLGQRLAPPLGVQAN